MRFDCARSKQRLLIFGAPPIEQPPEREETFEEALETCFPLDPLGDDYLWHEFLRLFPDYGL